MQWEHIFGEHILVRGMDYYMRDSVEIKTHSSDSVTAKVKGSQTYEVEINFDNENVIGIYCDCPHAAEGNHCKHAAAVLYAVDSDRSHEDMDIASLVNEADDEVVRDFLIDILQADIGLAERFQRRLDLDGPELELTVYKIIIDEFFHQHSDNSGFISYYQAQELEMDLDQFIQVEIENTLMERQEYQKAFELLAKIFVDLSEKAIDDSGGIITYLSYDIVKIWQDILNVCDIKLKRQMYDWFKSQLDTLLDEYIEEVLFENFREKEFLEDKRVFAKENFDQSKGSDSEWEQEYEAEKWAVKYLETLELLHQEKELEAFVVENLDYARVTEFYVDQLVERNDYDKAIQLLEENKAKGDRFAGISREYEIKLKELYKQVGDETAHRNQLWDLVTDRTAVDIEHFHEYKSLYAEEEWADKRLEVLDNLFNLRDMDRILAEEELYELLLEYVVKQYSLSYLQDYEDLLVKLYPQQVFDRYEKEIMALSEKTGSRKKYRKIVYIIRDLQALPNSAERVTKIVVNLKTNYANRPAMMDELSKL